jgi:hypothetical protein
MESLLPDSKLKPKAPHTEKQPGEMASIDEGMQISPRCPQRQNALAPRMVSLEMGANDKLLRFVQPQKQEAASVLIVDGIQID